MQKIHTIHVEPLRAAIRALVRGFGSEEREVNLVTENLIEANLTGHDSHGIGMLPRYSEAFVDGGLIGPTGHIGWFIPKFVADAHPEYKTWEGLKTAAAAKYFATAETGEDTYVRCTTCDYAANVEAVTTTVPAAIDFADAPQALVSDTPDTPTIATLVDLLNARDDLRRADRAWQASDTLKNVVFDSHAAALALKSQIRKKIRNQTRPALRNLPFRALALERKRKRTE